MELIQQGPKTTNMLVFVLRRERFGNYSFWTPADLRPKITGLLKYGLIKKVASAKGIIAKHPNAAIYKVSERGKKKT